jgi:methionyl-tRNA formyltransferase
VKLAAEELGLSVYQPATLKSEQDREPLIATDADLFVVAAYGLIFGRKTLEIPRFDCVNLHASLLPKYRGASPVAAAIAAGDEETGVSLMKMEAGLDTGPVIAKSSIKIAPNDTSQTLTARLGELGGELARDQLVRYASGELEAESQHSYGASEVRPLTKADGWLDWTWPASKLEHWVRAMWPWPRAWTTIEGQPVQVHETSVAAFTTSERPGTVVAADKALAVQTGEGVLFLKLVQLASGKAIGGRVVGATGRIPIGAVLGEAGAPGPQPPIILELSAARD